jgi:hypothetical protein
MMQQESGFKTTAVSPKGARGLMQLMPATAARYGVRNPHDPVQAIRAGTMYLVWLLDRFGGNVRLGLAGYNAGEGAVDKYHGRIPPYQETQEYVKRIEQNYLRLARARRDAELGGYVTGHLPAPAGGTTAVVPSYSFRFRLPTAKGVAPAGANKTAATPATASAVHGPGPEQQ